MDDQPDPKVLESVDEGRRASLKKIILGAAFAVPVIASFTMSGLGVNEAYATIASNGKTCQHEHEHQHQHQPPPKPICKPLDPHSRHK
jgi:hypothetical protein